jgi:adenylate kinase family enzyme
LSTRVLVVGTSCAGKSTFARRLSALTGQPYVELDELFWGPEWTPKPKDEFVSRVQRIASQGSWIVEGNYGAVREILWPRATTVVWLNYPLPTVFLRGLRRTVRRCVTGEELWHGNRESARRSFLSKESILVWILSTHRRRNRLFAALRQDDVYPQLHWLEFRRAGDAERYLRELGAGSPAG